MSSPSTSVHHLVNTLRARRARVPSEVGAYLVLETCEKLQGYPRAISASQVGVGDAGEVALLGDVSACDERESAQSLCRLLSFLLVASEDNISAGLLEILEVDPSVWTLARLRDALEANLVPLNRQASRRVLSRLVRESQRPGPRSDFDEAAVVSVPGMDRLGASEVDASLDAFLNGDDVGASAPAIEGDPDLDLPDLDLPDLDLLALDPWDQQSPAAQHVAGPVIEEVVEQEQPVRQQSSIFSDRQSHFESLDETATSKSTWLWVGVGALLVVGLVAVSTLI